MRILFDQGTPAPLRAELSIHDVSTTFDRGWGRLKNGELLNRAETDGFEVFVTTDQNLRYQQNLGGRLIAIVVIKTTSWPRIAKALPTVMAAIESAVPGTYVEIAVPLGSHYTNIRLRRIVTECSLS